MMRYASLVLCLLATPVWADMYKWTDEDGKIHYSDQPPPTAITKSETIKAAKPPASQAPPADAPPTATGQPGATAPKSASDQEMEFRRRRLQQAELEAKTQKDAQAAEEKKRNCQRATAQVQAYERGGRITRYGPNGEQLYLTDGEVQTELSNARKSADSWCK